ncbi:15153_t:CDS:1, partial [Gigaspora rosea]
VGIQVIIVVIKDYHKNDHQETNKTEKTQKSGEVPTNFIQLFQQFLVNQDHINQKLAGIAEKQTA